MDPDNYVTREELSAIACLIACLNLSETQSALSNIGLDIRVTDLNGESIGEVVMIDGLYVYRPNGGSDE